MVLSPLFLGVLLSWGPENAENAAVGVFRNSRSFLLMEWSTNTTAALAGYFSTDELKVVNLRRELGERGEYSTRLKTGLHDRLGQMMIQNGEDTDTLEFESSDFERLSARIEQK